MVKSASKISIYKGFLKEAAFFCSIANIEGISITIFKVQSNSIDKIYKYPLCLLLN